ncbi:MAG: PAS domain-containing sensor histidine kinase [Arcobacteraceae bacterium]|jgi:PAS domain S-box-containing protein|nr:PAS domain-containing sensor histidine kinase [Arcobacteraceae bacterium]
MFNHLSSSFKITFAYLIFGILWILISDTLTNILSHSIENIQTVQLIKGWFFIFFSASILYFISKKLFKNLQQAKDEVDEAKALLENIINNAPVRIFWKDKNGLYLGANKLLLEDIGVKDISTLLGKNDKSLHIQETSEYMQDDQYVMKFKIKKLNYIETLTDKEGNRKILNTSKVPLLNKNGEVIGIIGVFQDITQHVEIENQIKKQEALILQQSKFASMGEMIANIAHQWRQPLSIISTSATGIKVQKEMGMLTDEFEFESLDSINENVQYLSKTIEDFRNFFKEEKIKNEVDIEEILSKTLSLVSSRLKNRNINIITSYERIVFETLETELIHVFINIINNAIDAFEDVTTEKFIFIQTQQTSNAIVISIKDNAGGIDPNILNLVFDPYFTTKEFSKGTGIGLYMCKEIVVKHLHGKIDVKNVEFDYKEKSYKGCEFTIEILI